MLRQLPSRDFWITVRTADGAVTALATKVVVFIAQAQDLFRRFRNEKAPSSGDLVLKPQKKQEGVVYFWSLPVHPFHKYMYKFYMSCHFWTSKHHPPSNLPALVGTHDLQSLNGPSIRIGRRHLVSLLSANRTTLVLALALHPAILTEEFAAFVRQGVSGHHETNGALGFLGFLTRFAWDPKEPRSQNNWRHGHVLFTSFTSSIYNRLFGLPFRSMAKKWSQEVCWSPPLQKPRSHHTQQASSPPAVPSPSHDSTRLPSRDPSGGRCDPGTTHLGSVRCYRQTPGSVRAWAWDKHPRAPRPGAPTSPDSPHQRNASTGGPDLHLHPRSPAWSSRQWAVPHWEGGGNSTSPRYHRESWSSRRNHSRWCQSHWSAGTWVSHWRSRWAHTAHWPANLFLLHGTHAGATPRRDHTHSRLPLLSGNVDRKSLGT